MFQSPLHRGMSADENRTSQLPSTLRLVSIPSSLLLFSTPSYSGHDCGRCRKQTAADNHRRFQSPLHRGMSADKETADASPEHYRLFQSPLHRGMSADGTLRPELGQAQRGFN